jgi:CRP/FNR family transcriptional regulator, cyclic AMP receptor protein
MHWRLLEGVPDEDVDRFLSVARKRSFGRNEVVFHQGDPADSMHLIRRGRFAVRVATPLGYVATIAILGDGDCFGELALVGAEPDRSATVVALEQSETYSVTRGDLNAFRRTHPQVSDVLLTLLAARIRRTNALLAEALYVPADQRVLHRLDELAELYASDDGETVIPLTQEEIADLAGTSRATVNRVLRTAQRAGSLDLSRGRTVVSDRARLRAALF